MSEIVSIHEEQNNLSGNSFSIQEGGLVSETNFSEFSSILGEKHLHQQCQEDCECDTSQYRMESPGKRHRVMQSLLGFRMEPGRNQTM